MTLKPFFIAFLCFIFIVLIIAIMYFYKRFRKNKPKRLHNNSDLTNETSTCPDCGEKLKKESTLDEPVYDTVPEGTGTQILIKTSSNYDTTQKQNKNKFEMLLNFPNGEIVDGYHVSSFPCTVGRQQSIVDICICEPSVSRRQLIFEIINDKIMVSDLDSRNGTLFNGQKLLNGEKRTIKDSDRLKMGRVEMVIEKILEG